MFLLCELLKILVFTSSKGPKYDLLVCRLFTE